MTLSLTSPTLSGSPNDGIVLLNDDLGAQPGVSLSDQFDDAVPLTDTSSGPSSAVSAGDGLASGSADEFASLTPDALMTYCEARLNSIGDQVNTIFSSQELRNSETTATQTVIQAFQANLAGVNNDPATCTAIETSLQNLIVHLKATDPDCPGLGALEQTYNNVLFSGTGPTGDLKYQDPDLYPAHQATPSPDQTYSDTEMQGYVSNLQSFVSGLNSDSELQMVQLQSLMSQRQTAIELTTNLVQSLGDQSEKIAENVGR
jgi:hypothetical protein